MDVTGSGHTCLGYGNTNQPRYMRTTIGYTMSTYIQCPAPGLMLNGAHVSHIPGRLNSLDLLTFTQIHDAGIMCPTCQGNGMVPA